MAELRFEVRGVFNPSGEDITDKNFPRFRSSLSREKGMVHLQISAAELSSDSLLHDATAMHMPIRQRWRRFCCRRPAHD